MDKTMRRTIAIIATALAAGLTAASMAQESTAAPALTAEQIVEKNVTARGGLEAWRKIQTMVWVGHMESPGGPMSQIPFVLQQKRPNKTRFEVNAPGQRTLRVFDGKRGWKVRPAQDGRPDVQPFSTQEIRYAQGEVVIDSPLFGYESKRVAVELDGVDQVDGRKAYRLIMRTPSGERHNVWVDAETFLDVKYDRTSYNRGGRPVTVEVHYRDYKAIEGLQIPGTIETGSRQGSEKMVIEKVTLNPPLDDRVFGRPGGPQPRTTVTIEPEAPQGPAPMPTAPENAHRE
jgi:outer membrane lipoprotein-sorting protein